MMSLAPIFAVALALPSMWRPYPIDVRRFKVLERDSGPSNYYRVIDEQPQSFIRGVYETPSGTVTLFSAVPDELRRGVRRMRWRWRALVLPLGGNECVAGRGDSAANVYVTWKRGLRWYSLKFVWSSEAARNTTCNGIRSPLVFSDSIVLRSGGPLGVWHDEEIDPDALFREHFADGDPDAKVPELQGIGLMSDGDQTRSLSAADYAGFILYK
jgi:hypothetical protein